MSCRKSDACLLQQAQARIALLLQQYTSAYNSCANSTCLGSYLSPSAISGLANSCDAAQLCQNADYLQFLINQLIICCSTTPVPPTPSCAQIVGFATGPTNEDPCIEDNTIAFSFNITSGATGTFQVSAIATGPEVHIHKILRF